jgi:ElaB/YqjD/DUF883 family membrane-anchored ribosome-binding protein
MSLANYKSRCIEKYKIANPDKDIPANMGSKWTDAEERALLDSSRNNLDIEEIAKKHGRTQGAINARLEVVAMRMYEDNLYDTEYIEELTKMNECRIQEAIYKKNKSKGSGYGYGSGNGNYCESKNTRDIEIDVLKRDLQKYYDELQELKTTITNIMDMYSKNNKDEVDDLKKQIQNMIDIHNIKKEIVELRKDTERLTQAVAAVAVVAK